MKKYLSIYLNTLIIKLINVASLSKLHSFSIPACFKIYHAIFYVLLGSFVVYCVLNVNTLLEKLRLYGLLLLEYAKGPIKQMCVLVVTNLPFWPVTCGNLKPW